MRNWGLKSRSEARKTNIDEILSHGLVYIYICTSWINFTMQWKRVV